MVHDRKSIDRNMHRKQKEKNDFEPLCPLRKQQNVANYLQNFKHALEELAEVHERNEACECDKGERRQHNVELICLSFEVCCIERLEKQKDGSSNNWDQP